MQLGQSILNFNQRVRAINDEGVQKWNAIQTLLACKESEILDLEFKIGFQIPRDLKDFLTQHGAIENPMFGNAWNTIQLFTAKKIASSPAAGILQHMKMCWGGLPYMDEHFSNDQLILLNSNFIVFGKRYEDDNVHDYFFFDKNGRISNVYFNQDDASNAIKRLNQMLEYKHPTQSLDELLQEQLDRIISVLEQEAAEECD